MLGISRPGTERHKAANAVACPPPCAAPQPCARPWFPATGRARRPDTSTGARPCARRGSEPIQRTRAPVWRSSMRACCAVSQTFHRCRSSSLSPMKATTCSKAIRACSKDDATNTTSPRGTASGPSRLAHAIVESNAVFPLPRAIESAALPVPAAKAPRTKRDCHGRTVNGCPARRPCEMVRPAR